MTKWSASRSYSKMGKAGKGTDVEHGGLGRVGRAGSSSEEMGKVRQGNQNTLQGRMKEQPPSMGNCYLILNDQVNHDLEHLPGGQEVCSIHY